ncbi:2-hydroxyacid dehydrogenase [Tichowtungia aerotolerans]|uniref:2-hydroxyacid dehydrogenase n=1 Tax=Tichowtungia aerotolerans TaxID=2697043 RepID=A0A6P1M4L2_9BACT|nr:2-hydroxyacid dehydrogenase [Tichowtungia aerotolerans]QHI68781.1 2-hydroxyacid dehydrogenase [Tichowtungia aerotolerans]
MKTVVFSTKPYDREFLSRANESVGLELAFLESRLAPQTVKLAEGFESVCVFVNDQLDASVLIGLKKVGVKHVALRCAGFNNVDIASAEELGLTVTRVPAYSPYAIAEHAVALMLTLNRRIYWAHSRVRDGNYSLDGLLGFDLHGKTVGIVGTGKIGQCLTEALHGFGCKLLGVDQYENERCKKVGMQYVSFEEMLAQSDIISLHCPLMPETYHLIDNEAVAHMKRGVMIINTSRGGLIDTKAVIEGLKSGKIGYMGLDVYEEEEGLFFEDKTFEVRKDDDFARLTTFPNVIITGHQAYFTREALIRIAETTLANLSAFASGEELINQVKAS